MWRKGFTLIELIVVIAIIAILAAVIAPNAFKAIEKSKTSATIGELQSIKTAALSYFVDVGAFPVSCDGNTACTTASAANATFIQNSTGGTGTTGWDGPYLQKWPVTTRFGGNYSWVNAANNLFGPGTVGERFLSAAGSTLNDNVKNSMDKAIDGGLTPNLGSGELRNTTGVTTSVSFLVSRDGSIN